MNKLGWKTLFDCRRDNWCWLCQQRPAVRNDGVNAPSCEVCVERYWVKEAK